MPTSDELAALVGPILAADGATLYDVELAGDTVRVLVEGASLADLERLSPKVSELLDEADVMPEQWYLEVSSPGLERSLRRPEHFRGALGSTVKVKTRSGVDGDRRLEGVLAEADDDGVTVGSRRLAYDQIDSAKTVFVWPGSPKPGAPRGAKQRSTP